MNGLRFIKSFQHRSSVETLLRVATAPRTAPRPPRAQEGAGLQSDWSGTASAGRREIAGRHTRNHGSGDDRTPQPDDRVARCAFDLGFKRFLHQVDFLVNAVDLGIDLVVQRFHILADKLDFTAQAFLDPLQIRLVGHTAGHTVADQKRDRLGLFLRNARIPQTLDFRDGIECRCGHMRSLAGPFRNINTLYALRQSARGIAAALLVLLWLTVPAPAQTLGIDCDQPRRNADGKLILGGDGSQQAQCEADRATALNYAAVVHETGSRIRSALQGLPPPLWGDLVAHLRTSDDIDDWTYADATVLNALETLSAAAPAGEPGDIAPMARASDKAASWKSGLLAGKTSYPDDWRGIVKARACGVDASGAVRNGAAVLVWLEPDAIRDRWTPEMVQRTVRARMARREGQYARLDHIPEIVTGTGRLKAWNGNIRDVSGTAAIRGCFFAGANAVPEGALAMQVMLRRKIDMDWKSEICADPDQVGSRQLMWARHNGVYIVPEEAVQEDGSPHPDRGDPLLDPPVTSEAAAWHLTGSTCRAPRTIDAVRAEDCDAEINGTPVKGTHIRRFRFREVQNDPHDKFRIDMVPVGPGNGELGVIADAGKPHPVWETVTLFCEGELPDSDAPNIPEPEYDPDWDIPDCAAAHGGQFDEGERRGYRQTITYPPDWPVRDVEVRTIEDDCFAPDVVRGTEERPGPLCPAGHSGEIVEGRDLSWWNRDWAVPSRHDNGDAGDRTLEQAIRDYNADPSQAGLDWYDMVLVEKDWHVDKLTCTAPVQVTDTQTRDGSCPAGQTGDVTESRRLSWYNRDPGAVPPHVITDREVDEAAASYDADPGQTGLPWFRKVTATPWQAQSSNCRPARTCGNTCAERGGVETRNSEGEECVSPKLPKCSTSGIKSGNDGGEEGEGAWSVDTDGDGKTDTEANRGDPGAENRGVEDRGGHGNEGGDDE